MAPNWQFPNPNIILQKCTDKNFFLTLNLGHHYLSDNIKKGHSNWIVQKPKVVWRKRNNPKHKESVTFFESRNNNSGFGVKHGFLM